MQLREATLNDAELLFKWANDPIMRQNSFNPNLIKWENHINWFSNKHGSEDSKIYIAYNENNPCGQIRFDKKNQYAYVDFFIDKEFRGKGFGKELLLKGFEQISGEWTGLIAIIGKVKKNNIASRKSFLNALFEESIDTEVYIYVKKRI